MRRVGKSLRAHVDEAAYLYGFSRGLAERLAVTRFILRKKGAQLAGRLGPPRPDRLDVAIELYGARHVVDLLGAEIYLLDEIYRERLYDRRDDFVPGPGWTVVDAGANVGTFAVLQALRGARVHAFEPNPDCYRRLVRSVVENGVTAAVSLQNAALGRGAGTGTLRVPNEQTALGSVTSSEDGTAVHPGIRITSLDLALPALGVDRVDLLKVDVEGAEVDVLAGAERSLRCVDRVVLEYHSAELRRQVGELLAGHGFEEALHVDTPAPYLPDAGMIYARRTTPAG